MKKSLFIVTVFLAMFFVGCVTGPIPKTDISIPLIDGSFLRYPAGGFSEGIYFTPEEMKDPKLYWKRMQIINKFMNNRERQKTKKGGCLPGEICG